MSGNFGSFGQRQDLAVHPVQTESVQCGYEDLILGLMFDQTGQGFSSLGVSICFLKSGIHRPMVSKFLA